MKEIALFDFDGTITRKDSFIEFVKFSKGKFKLLSGVVLNLPVLVAYKLKMISNQAAKERMLQFFFKGMPLKEFQQICDGFSRQRLPYLVRDAAIGKIKQLQNGGVTVVIVSASPENWIANWAAENNLNLIATRLEVEGGKISGKIRGNNCYGIEKVNRIRQQFDLEDYDKIYAFGNHYSDRYMLDLADAKYLNKFE